MKIPALIPLVCFFSNASFAQSEYSDNTIHVGVVVTDLEKSLDFYINVMGMVKTGTIDLNDDFAKRSGLNKGSAFSIKVLKLEDTPGATQWKLMSFDKKANHPRQKYVPDDTGMQYITVMVKSLQPFIDRLQANKIDMLGETPTEINDEISFILIQDPDGNFIEIIGPPGI